LTMVQNRSWIHCAQLAGRCRPVSSFGVFPKFYYRCPLRCRCWQGTSVQIVIFLYPIPRVPLFLMFSSFVRIVLFFLPAPFRQDFVVRTASAPWCRVYALTSNSRPVPSLCASGFFTRFPTDRISTRIPPCGCACAMLVRDGVSPLCECPFPNSRPASRDVSRLRLNGVWASWGSKPLVVNTQVGVDLSRPFSFPTPLFSMDCDGRDLALAKFRFFDSVL